MTVAEFPDDSTIGAALMVALQPCGRCLVERLDCCCVAEHI